MSEFNPRIPYILKTLESLYPDAVPERGGVVVTMGAAEVEGTTGVIAQVFTLITGAAANNGFHGIGGQYARHNLLRYGGGDRSSIASFRRADTGDTVHLSMDLSSIPPAPQLRELMVRALAADATSEERAAFGSVWQDRVRRLLLEHPDDPAVIRVERRA